MAVKEIGGLDFLIDLACRFVKDKKGVWDHQAWLDFLLDIQKNGIELSDEMKSNLGLVADAMRKFYEVFVATKGVENVMLSISEHAVDFFKKTRGVWNQSEWEAFLQDLNNDDIELTKEMRGYIGEVLESITQLYSALPLRIIWQRFSAPNETNIMKDSEID